jgi:hypothetical protein
MSNPKFKGRQAGTVKRKSMIEDPSLGNYKISIDEDCFNIILVDPETKNEKSLGYPTRLSSALMSIAKHQALDKPNYTIQEYIKEIESKFNTLTNSITI